VKVAILERRRSFPTSLYPQRISPNDESLSVAEIVSNAEFRQPSIFIAAEILNMSIAHEA
jgi:hypothetical protein